FLLVVCPVRSFLSMWGSFRDTGSLGKFGKTVSLLGSFAEMGEVRLSGKSQRWEVSEMGSLKVCEGSLAVGQFRRDGGSRTSREVSQRKSSEFVVHLPVLLDFSSVI